MPEAKMTFIIEAKDETKKAIDSASKNLEKLKQESGISSKGVQLPPRDSAGGKREIRIRQAIIHIEKARDNNDNKLSGLSNIQSPQLLNRNRLNQGTIGNIVSTADKRNVLKVEIVKSIPLPTIGGGQGGTGGRGSLDSFGSAGMRSWQQGGEGMMAGIGKSISPLAFGVGAILGTAITIASKISQKYEQNIMEQMPYAGAVGTYNFNRQGRSESLNKKIIGLREAQTSDIKIVEEAKRKRLMNQGRAAIQGGGLGFLIQTLFGGGETDEEKQAKKNIENRNKQIEKIQDEIVKQQQDSVTNLSKFGLKPADVQRMAFEQSRAGGKTQMAQNYNFSAVAGYARAVGIDPAQAAQMQGQLQRYGGSLQKVGGYGQIAGYKGAMNVEFVQAVTEAVKDGVSQGFEGTPDQIAKSMAMMTNIKGIGGQAIGADRGMAIYRSVSGMMRGAGTLKEGTTQEMMLRTTLDRLQQENPNLAPDELLQKAMAQLQNPANMQQVMQDYMGSMTGIYGTGAMRNIATAQSLGIGIERGADIARTDWEKEQQRMNILQQRGIQRYTPYAEFSTRGGNDDIRRSYEITNKQIALQTSEAAEMIHKAVTDVKNALLDLASGIANAVKEIKGHFETRNTQ